jgi:signal transduction histidine kinase
MTLVKDKSNQSALDGIHTIRLTSSTKRGNNNRNSSSVSINNDLNSSAFPLINSLACIKQISQAVFPHKSEEEERKRISRELHDGLGQLLTSMNLHVQRCLEGGGDNDQDDDLSDHHRESLETVSLMVKQAMVEVRSICSAIRPAILDDLGVIAAISWQCRQIIKINDNTNVATDFDLDEGSIPEEYKIVIYRIVQESLNNAVKYSKADNITVSLLEAHNAIHLSIIDDGIGFDSVEVQGKLGMGLVGMRERVESVQGSFQIASGHNQGVQIRASFPLRTFVLNG